MLKASFFTKPLAVLLAVLTVAMPCTLNKASANSSSEYATELLSTGTTTSGSTKNAFYIKSSYSKLFNNPSAKYRWVALNHDLSNIKDYTYQHVPTWQSNGMGGTVTQIATNSGNEWGHYEDGYLSNLNNFNILNELTGNIWNAAGGSDNMKIWLYDEIGYPSGTANGMTLENSDYLAKGLVMVTKKKSSSSSAEISLTSLVNAIKNNYYRLPSLQIGFNQDAYNEDVGNFTKFVYAYVKDANGNIYPVTTLNNDNVYFNGKDQNGSNITADWTLYAFAEKELYEGTHAQKNSNGATHYINIMNADAVEEFISNTYRPYAVNYTYFDQVIGVFTDEPSLMEKYQNTNLSYNYAQLAWVDGFDDVFQSMHGYSLFQGDILRALFEDTTDDDIKIVRTNYRQTVAKLVSENYFGQLADFCEENGTALTGHGVLEERLYDHVLYYGDLMQSLRQMQIPGVDVLYGNSETYFSKGVFMSTKYATSVKTLTGDDRMTMVEFAPTDVASEQLSAANKNSFLKILNMLLYQGITNIISYFPIEYFGTDAATRKQTTDYLARLTYMSRQAQWDGDIGLYYPINTSQAYSVPTNSQNPTIHSNATYIDEVAQAIYANNMDFTVVDNEFLINAKIAKIDEKTTILYNDYVSFKAIVMPAVEVISYDAILKLVEFQNAGGKVYWLKTIPNLIDITSKYVTNETERAKITHFIDVLKPQIASTDLNTAIAQIKSSFGYGVETSYSNVYVGKYKIDGSTMFWVYNYNDSSATVTLSNSLNAKSFDVYDPTTGEIQTISAENASVTLSGNKAKLIVANNVEINEYVQLKQKMVYLVTMSNVPYDENTTYTCNNEDFFWSKAYKAYCTLVVSDTDVIPEIIITSKEGSPTILNAEVTDVNMSDTTDLNDAQLVWNIYNNVYNGFTETVTLEKFLYADVNGDKKIDVDDCVAIVNSIPEEELE